MLCVPMPATEGLKMLPTIDGPVNTPPIGLAVMVTDVSLIHNLAGGFTNVMVGKALMVMLLVLLLLDGF